MAEKRSLATMLGESSGSGSGSGGGSGGASGPSGNARSEAGNGKGTAIMSADGGDNGSGGTAVMDAAGSSDVASGNSAAARGVGVQARETKRQKRSLHHQSSRERKRGGKKGGWKRMNEKKKKNRNQYGTHSRPSQIKRASSGHRVERAEGEKAMREIFNDDGSVTEVPRISKRKVALRVAYCGKGYNGSQVQPEQNIRTIEGDLVKAIYESGGILKGNLGKLARVGFSRTARTDKGVSAAGNIFALKIMVGKTVAEQESMITLINKRLVQNILPPPASIKVLNITPVSKGFNAKNHCCSRVYEYLLPTYVFASESLLRSAIPPPNHVLPSSGSAKDGKGEVSKLHQFRVSETTLEALRAVFTSFQGTHNFHNFTKKVRYEDPSAKRYIKSFTVEDPLVVDGIEILRLRVHGNSFMMNQIRKMVAFATEVVRRGLLLDKERDMDNSHTCSSSLSGGEREKETGATNAKGVAAEQGEKEKDKKDKRYDEEGEREKGEREKARLLREARAIFWGLCKSTRYALPMAPPDGLFLNLCCFPGYDRKVIDEKARNKLRGNGEKEGKGKETSGKGEENDKSGGESLSEKRPVTFDRAEDVAQTDAFKMKYIYPTFIQSILSEETGERERKEKDKTSEKDEKDKAMMMVDCDERTNEGDSAGASGSAETFADVTDVFARWTLLQNKVDHFPELASEVEKQKNHFKPKKTE